MGLLAALLDRKAHHLKMALASGLRLRSSYSMHIPTAAFPPHVNKLLLPAGGMRSATSSRGCSYGVIVLVGNPFKAASLLFETTTRGIP
ncbi:jg4936 [Pararge aegeria aegeria]|uniref:Jg4936 protein n=1 Tax=Pararge aegeria aegeria TaxID=348720 RepID=A0A8S4SBL8_9NEOP|nr:jg4936 [Pararge aegeria aegeria]